MTLVLKWSHGRVVFDRAGGLLSAKQGWPRPGTKLLHREELLNLALSID